MATLREQDDVDNDTARAGHLYAVRFSTGIVKVGRANDPAQRIAAHAAGARVHDVTVAGLWVSDRVPRVDEAEMAIVDFCSGRWPTASGSEYFRGADLSTIADRANCLGVTTRELREVSADEAQRLGPRALALATEMGLALGRPVQTRQAEAIVRLHAPAPAPEDTATWEATMAALRNADRWGSTDTTGTPEIWAEIHEVGQ